MSKEPLTQCPFFVNNEPQPLPELTKPAEPLQSPELPEPPEKSESHESFESPESSKSPESPEAPLEVLARLAEASKARRLAPEDEERAAALLKGLLAGGKAGITSALEPLLNLSWIVGVNAVGAVWADLSVPMRRHLLASLAKSDTEQARRVRLSLARAIFKIDPPAGLKLAAATAADLKEGKDDETGALSPRHRQIFFNVFIGKGKPWLLQLPLADLKGADADTLVHCAIDCFPICPPLSQLSILRWAYGAGRLKKLSETDLGIATKSVGRWNAKLQHQLRTEIPELPEAIVAVLKPEPTQPPGAAAVASPSSQKSRDRQPSAPEKHEQGEPADETAAFEKAAAGEPEKAAPEASAEAVPTAPATSTKPEPPEELVIPKRNQPGQPVRQEAGRPQDRTKDRPERLEPRQQEERRGNRRDDRERKPFDFKESLRALENYVVTLRGELDQTKSQLRRREEEAKRGGRPARAERGAEETRSPAETESLVRHNVQLETTVQQLRQQLEDLATHHEAVAESRLLHTGEPLPEGSGEQLKTLLSIKLQESYETYTAMRLEPLDRVFRLDYRDLLGSVFEVLIEQGVALETKQAKKIT